MPGGQTHGLVADRSARDEDDRVGAVLPAAAQQLGSVGLQGHAVAAMASIYAELGYFDRSVLKGSRSYSSILNGHQRRLGE